jgi:hypothetical protein
LFAGQAGDDKTVAAFRWHRFGSVVVEKDGIAPGEEFESLAKVGEYWNEAGKYYREVRST